jgi:hypothetical protein
LMRHFQGPVLSINYKSVRQVNLFEFSKLCDNNISIPAAKNLSYP